MVGVDYALDKIDIEESCVKDGAVWFLEQDKQWIVKYTINTKKVEIIDVLPEEIKKKMSIGCILKKDNTIYFAPLFADDIYYYDLEEYEWKRLNIPLDSFEGMVSRKRMEVVDGGEYVYCISRWPDFILRINHKTKEYEKIDMVSGKYSSKLNIPFYNKIFPWSDSEGILHFVLCENVIIHFNPYETSFSADELKRIKCEMIQLDNKKQNMDFIRWSQDFGTFKMVCTWSGKVYKITKDTVICDWNLMELCMKDYKEKTFLVENVVATQEYIYYFLSYDSSIIKQDIITGSIHYIDNLVEANYKQYVKRYHVIKKIDDKRIFLWSYSSHNAYILDTETDSIQKIDFTVDLETFNGKGVQQIKYLMKDNMFMVDDLSVLLESLQKGILDE